MKYIKSIYNNDYVVIIEDTQELPNNFIEITQEEYYYLLSLWAPELI